jgi:hypothetical protein
MKTPAITPAAIAAAEHIGRIARQAPTLVFGNDKPPELPDIRQLLLHSSGQETMTFMEPAEAFDECIVGTSEVAGETVAVYNKMAVIAALAGMAEITFEKAFDQFTGSELAQRTQALADAAGVKLPQSPLFIVDLRDVLA